MAARHGIRLGCRGIHKCKGELTEAYIPCMYKLKNCIFFLTYQQTLECVNAPGVFAVGDVCNIIGYPRPKAGVFAVRAG